MMRIRVYCISKPQNDAYGELTDHFIKLSKAFNASLEVVEIFNKSIALAQKSANERESALAYCTACEPYLEGGYNIALTPTGKMLDTKEFAEVVRQKEQGISFFIGGAYGFGEGFLQKCSMRLSLSALTMGHKIAKVILCEQIYRALTILHHHPYHK